MLEIFTPPYAATAPKGAGSSLAATLSDIAKELLPTLVAILVVLVALSVPVLLILWRLGRAYS